MNPFWNRWPRDSFVGLVGSPCPFRPGETPGESTRVEVRLGPDGYPRRVFVSEEVVVWRRAEVAVGSR